MGQGSAADVEITAAAATAAASAATLGPRSGLVGQGLLRVAFRAAFALI